jgi:uncharacterized iron-regulated protein
MARRTSNIFIGFFIATMVFQNCVESEQQSGQIDIFRTADGKTINFKLMTEEMKKVNVVFLGETHNIESHHRIQLDIIKLMNTSRIPVVVGLEMFTVENQGLLDQWVEGTLPLDKFVQTYYQNWNFPWPYYRDIFMYIRDNKIPAMGLNLPPEITRKVSRAGFSSLTKEEMAKLPPETGCVVNEEYMKFIRRAYAMHGHSGKQFIFFCEAQLLWDQVMARNILEFHKKNPERVIVVITGNGHAWKRGMPEQIRRLSPKISYRVLIQKTPGRIEPVFMTSEDADYILSIR